MQGYNNSKVLTDSCSLGIIEGDNYQLALCYYCILASCRTVIERKKKEKKIPKLFTLFIDRHSCVSRETVGQECVRQGGLIFRYVVVSIVAHNRKVSTK